MGIFSYNLNCHSPSIQRGHEIPPNQLDTIHMYCVHVAIQYEGPSPATTPSIVISFFKWNMKAHSPCYMYNSIVTVTALFYRKIWRPIPLYNSIGIVTAFFHTLWGPTPCYNFIVTATALFTRTGKPISLLQLHNDSYRFEIPPPGHNGQCTAALSGCLLTLPHPNMVNLVLFTTPDGKILA